MEVDVLIVGAGPTGLTLACELARRGVAHRLIERRDGPAEGSRGKGVQPRSLEVLGDLGVADALIAHGRFDMPMLLHGEDGSMPLPLVSDVRDGARYAGPLLTPQWRVEAVLRNRLAELGSTVEWGCELTGIEQRDDRVVAEVRRGNTNERIETSWLIGCDGGQSGVRKAASVPFVGKTLERIRMWVGDLTLDGLDRDYWHLWRGPEGFLALCPLPSTDQFQFQAQIAPEEAREPSLAAFDTLIRQRTRREDIHLHAAGWLSAWRANVRMAQRFRIGRVLLAGDAAHVHSPAGAQGMNTGIQDAYNLGWKLAAVCGGADEDLIDTYQEERLPIARGVLDLSSELTSTAFAPDRRRDARTTQLDLGYRGSTLSVDATLVSATIRAGDRAPDPAGLRRSAGTERRLSDLMRGTQVTLLVFAHDLPTPLTEMLASFGNAVRCIRIVADGAAGADCWIDVEGSARRLYAPTADALFAIRPDGYVGFCGSSADHVDLAHYLRRFVAASQEI